MAQIMFRVKEALAQLDILQPKSFVNYLISITYTQNYMVLENITNMIVYYFHSINQYQYRLKYLILIDYLLETSTYRNFLDRVILNFFVKAFIMAFNKKDCKQIEILKQMRKKWERENKLSKGCSYQIRRIIFEKIKLDIDLLMKYENYRCFSHLNHQQIFQKRLSQYSYTTLLSNSKIQSTNINRYCQRQKPINSNGIFNIKRSANQQYDLQVFSKVRKLRKLNLCECKCCGKSFSSYQSLENHKNSIFQQNLQKYQQKKSNKSKFMKLQQKNKPFLMNIQNWIDENQHQDQPKDISIDSQVKNCYYCYFCNQQLQLDFQQNNWIIKGAALIEIEGITNYAHRNCFKTMNE